MARFLAALALALLLAYQARAQQYIPHPTPPLARCWVTGPDEVVAGVLIRTLACELTDGTPAIVLVKIADVEEAATPAD